MITREQVADLQPGDVVELHRQGWAEDVVVRGTVLGDTCNGELYLGDYQLTSATSLAPEWLNFPETTLTVVSRAPRPMYVNHPRTAPVPGDVALDEDADGIRLILRMSAVRRRDEAWYDQDGTERTYEHLSPSRRLRLLVDGTTGQAVP